MRCPVVGRCGTSCPRLSDISALAVLLPSPPSLGLTPLRIGVHFFVMAQTGIGPHALLALVQVPIAHLGVCVVVV